MEFQFFRHPHQVETSTAHNRFDSLERHHLRFYHQVNNNHKEAAAGIEIETPTTTAVCRTRNNTTKNVKNSSEDKACTDDRLFILITIINGPLDILNQQQQLVLRARPSFILTRDLNLFWRINVNGMNGQKQKTIIIIIKTEG